MEQVGAGIRPTVLGGLRGTPTSAHRTVDLADGRDRIEVHVVPAGFLGECGGDPAQVKPRPTGQLVHDALGGLTGKVPSLVVLSSGAQPVELGEWFDSEAGTTQLLRRSVPHLSSGTDRAASDQSQEVQ